ncbi:MAG: type IV pilus twitching motility protein PilT [Burkholderiales bacterium]
MDTRLLEWLSQTRHMGASDLHLSAGLPPMVRHLGQLQSLTNKPLSPDQMPALLASALPDWPASNSLQPTLGTDNLPTHVLDHDTAVSVDKLGRFRVNVFAQQRGWSSVWRAIPAAIPSLQDIGAPPVLRDWAMHANGLLLVTGATGSGKSTTLAALLHHLNTTQALHILTLEDPIEFEHPSQRSLVQQRSVPGHCASFDLALRAALRQDPDVIMVGELRDLTTIRLALAAAETGHLVLASLHTRSATQAVERLVDVFPAEEKSLVRSQLSLSLLAVVTQTLCLHSDGQRRVAAHEVLYATPAVRHLIRENKTAQLPNALQTGAQFGMQTMAQSLEKLVKSGVISAEEATRHVS